MGAIIVVVTSPNASEAGLSGIVLLETKRSFIVITEKNERKSNFMFSYTLLIITQKSTKPFIYNPQIVILKKGRVFGIKWRGSVILLYGDSIICTGSERSRSKFKEKRVKALL